MVKKKAKAELETNGDLLGKLLAGLPPIVRELLPFDSGAAPEKEKEIASPTKKSGTSWQDVCFVHSAPGEDDDEGLLVLGDGSMRKFISCKGINALLFDDAEREQFARDFASLANSLESDIQIVAVSKHQNVDEYLKMYQTAVKTDNDYLRWYADVSDKWFRRSQELHFVSQREFFVIVSYQPPDCRNVSRGWSGKRSVQKHEEFQEELNQYCKSVFEQLRASSLRPAMLTRREMRELVYQHLNPALSQIEPEAPPSRPGVTEAAVLARSRLKVSDNYLLFDGKYVGTQYMQQVPEEALMGWLVAMLDLNVEYTSSLFIHCCDQDAVAPRKNKTSGSYPRISDRESPRTAQSAIKEFLKTTNKVFDMSFYIKTHADSLDRLAANMDEIRRVFRKEGANIDRAQMLQLEAWQSSLPVGVDRLAIVHRVETPMVASFCPFFTGRCGTPEGVPFGFAVRSKEPVLLNPFYRGTGKDANNMLVTGGIGSGKSFAVSMLMMRLMPLGVRFVTVTKSVERLGAYRSIVELLGPDSCVYVELGPKSTLVVNPFDIGPDDGKTGDPSADKMNTLLALFDIMLAPEGFDELNGAEKALLDQLIRLAYMDAAVRGVDPTMSDLARVTAQAAGSEMDPGQRERLQLIGRGLSYFTRPGPYGALVDGLTNIDSEKQLILFDTREINDSRLLRIASFVTTEFIRRKAAEAKKRNMRFAAVIDDAASLMQFSSGARLLDDLSRRSRHYGMMLVTVSGQMKEFFRFAEFADSVVRNANMKLVCRHDDADMGFIKERLHLTGAELQAIQNIPDEREKRKENQLLLSVGGISGTIRLLPMPMDYWVCTSDPYYDGPRRKDMVDQVKAQNPNINNTDACRQSIYLLGGQQD